MLAFRFYTRAINLKIINMDYTEIALKEVIKLAKYHLENINEEHKNDYPINIHINKKRDSYLYGNLNIK